MSRSIQMQTAQRSPAVGPASRGSSPFRLRAGRHASPLSRPAFALDLDEDELLHAPGDRDARIRALEEDLERSVFGTPPAAVVSPSNGGDEGNGDFVPLHVTIRTRSNSISSALTDVDFWSNVNPRAPNYDQEPEENKTDKAVQQPNSTRPCPCPRTASKYNAMLVSKNGSPAAKDAKKAARPTKATQVYKHASKYDAMQTAKRGSQYDAMPALQKAKHFHAQQDLPSNAAQQKLADAKRTKQEFRQFIKMLARYLKKHDPAMYKKAMAAIEECYEKHKAGDPRFASLTASYRVRLRKVVGRSHWLKANYYFGRSQETGGKENREAQENLCTAASTTPMAQNATALRPALQPQATPTAAQHTTSTAAAARTKVHLGKRKAPPEIADVAPPEAKRMKEEEKVRKMTHLKWERDADVAPLAMCTEKENNLEDDLEEATRLWNEILSQITAGTKVEVYWPRYAKHFPGTVTACHRTLDHFGERHELFSTIHYDDGDIETVDLTRTPFRIRGENVVGHVVACNGLKEPVDGAFPTQKSVVPSAPVLPAAAPPTTTVSITQRRNKILSRITVGMWIAVYWPDDDKFYPGIVASDSQDAGSNHVYTIRYDDGQQEKLDLSQETFHILDV